MGSTRSGRSRIDVVELRRAERMLASGQPIEDVASVIGIDRKTAARIAAGQHPEQIDPRFARCPQCGAISSPPCAACHAGPTTATPDTLSERIRSAATDAADPVPPIVPDPPPTVVSPSWTIGAIVGRTGSGKTTVARTWFPGAASSPTWQADQPIADSFRARDPTDVLTALEAVGLASPRQWVATIATLSSGERARAELVRVCLARRSVAVADPFIAPIAGPEAAALARRVGWAVRRGLLGTRRLIICTQSEAIAEAIGPDFWIDCPRFVLRHDRKAVR